jgi:hypothetical protein
MNVCEQKFPIILMLGTLNTTIASLHLPSAKDVGDTGTPTSIK